VPLVLTNTLGVRRLRIMGAPIAQFDDALVDRDCGQAVRLAIWHAIMRFGADLFETRRVRADSALGSLLPDGGVVTEMSEAPFACLSRGSMVEPGQAYSSKERSNVRRRQRRLAEMGTLAMTSYSGRRRGGAAGGAGYRHQAARPQGRRRVLACRAGAAVSKHSSAAPPQIRASGLLVTAVELDGRPVAVDLSFLCKTTAFGHVLATEPDMIQSGAGNVLVHHVLATAKAAGARTFRPAGARRRLQDAAYRRHNAGEKHDLSIHAARPAVCESLARHGLPGCAPC
jgi:CelD/BcsL family acetyltransferase involved in cellulose biosynthesis